MAYTKDIGLKDYYEFYKTSSIKKNKPYVEYNTFVKVIKSFNLKLRDKIIYESQKVKLPYRLGSLYVHKFENNYTEDNKAGWKVDYKATKEAGHVIYHGSKYGYKWKWVKKECVVKGKRWFQFKACRTASREIAKAVLTKNIDYYN